MGPGSRLLSWSRCGFAGGNDGAAAAAARCPRYPRRKSAPRVPGSGHLTLFWDAVTTADADKDVVVVDFVVAVIGVSGISWAGGGFGG